MSDFRFVSVLYLLISMLVLNLVHVNPFLLSVLAAPAFFLIPFLIGDLLVSRILNRPSENIIIHCFTSWLLGTLVLLTFALTLSILGMFRIQLFSASSLVLAIIDGIYEPLKHRCIHFPRILDQRYLRIILMSVPPLLLLGVFKFLTGFPGNYSIVGYRFTYLSEAMVQADRIDLSVLTGYAPLFQTPLAIVSALYNTDSYALDWSVVFIIAVFFFSGIYAFLRGLSFSTKYCLLGVFISSFIFIWDPAYFSGPLHDIQPRTLVFMMFPFALASVLYTKKHVRETKNFAAPVFTTFVVSISIFIIMSSLLHPELVDRRLIVLPLLIAVIYSSLFSHFDRSGQSGWLGLSLIICSFPIVHIFEGAFYVILLFSFSLFLILSQLSPRIFRILGYILFVSTFFWVSLIVAGVIQVPADIAIILPFAPTTIYGYTYNPSSSFYILENSLSPLVLLFLILGVTAKCISSTGNDDSIPLMLTLDFALMTYFLPIPDIVRISAALAPLAVYFVCGLFKEIELRAQRVARGFARDLGASGRIPRCRVWKKIRRKQVSSMYVVLIVVIIMPSLLTPFQTYVNSAESSLRDIGSSSQLSLVTDYEYQMGLWIRANTPRNAVILSDPETIYIMAGISGRSQPISTGMLIQDLQLADLIRLYWMKFNVLLSIDPIEAAFYAGLLGDYPVIVISGRSEKWLGQLQFAWAPYDFKDTKEQVLSKFLDNSSFTLLHNVDNKIYAFRLNDSLLRDISYDVFIVNYFSQYGNVTQFSSEKSNSTYWWYLLRQVTVGPVTTQVLEQYISLNGNPCTVQWKIPIDPRYNAVDLFVYNIDPLNTDPESRFAFSKDGMNWITGNFSYPLEHVFALQLNDGNITFYGKGAMGNTTKLGTFVFVGWKSTP